MGGIILDRKGTSYIILAISIHLEICYIISDNKMLLIVYALHSISYDLQNNSSCIEGGYEEVNRDNYNHKDCNCCWEFVPVS